MNMMKKIAASTIAGAIALSFSASAFAAADIAIVLKTLASPYWVAMKEGIVKEAKNQGIEVDIFAANSEDDIQGQQRVLEDAINKNYKGIGVAPITAVNLVQPIAAANKKGIYVVNLDEQVNQAQLKATGGSLVAFVATDNKALGEKAGAFILKQIGSAGKVAILEGKAGNTSGDNRRDGAKKAFDAAPNVKIVASLPADWDRTRALDVTTNILQRNPDLKAIYAANDTMALGAVQAIKNANKLGKVIVVGTDGVPEALDSIQRGELTATAAQDAAGVGATSLKLLVEALKNKPAIDPAATPNFVPVDSKIITK